MQLRNQRRTYETEWNQAKESEFALKLKNHWPQFKWIKTTKNFCFDYFVVEPDLQPISQDVELEEYYAHPLRAVAEIKCRNCFSYAYPTLLLSAKKLQSLRTWSDNSGYQANKKYLRTLLSPVYALICIRYLDKDVYYRYEQNEFIEQFNKGLCYFDRGGRTVQTRDEWDIEQVIHIHSSLFKEIPDA